VDSPSPLREPELGDQVTDVSAIAPPGPISDQITEVTQVDDDGLPVAPKGKFHTVVTRDTDMMNIAGYEISRGTTLGEYEIHGKLGEGGMGTVFSAIHPLIGKRAAIKVLKHQFCQDPGTIERFIDEARIVNQIGHPNIVDIFAFGEMPDGRRYFAMEWLVGETLRERLRRGRMSLPAMARTVKSLARALEAAHDKGVIHRDLKPENIFLADIAHDEPLVKLLDFGVAKLANEKRQVAVTGRGQILGTPMYIAPEQASNANDVGFASDVYSLGAIAFECLTGRPPFLGKNLVEMVTAHVTETPVAPSSLVPEVPEEIDGLVLEMLAKDPAQRPSLSHVRQMLELVRDPADLYEDPRAITVRRPDHPKTNPFGQAIPVEDPFSVRFSSGRHQMPVTDEPTAPAPARSSHERLLVIALIAVIASLAILFATGVIRV